MSQPPHILKPAFERYRRGDLVGARRALDEALAVEPNSAELLGLAGIIAAQIRDFPAAATHLQAALAMAPDDLATRVNLAMVLVSSGQYDKACEVCAGRSSEPKLLRLSAYAHQQAGRLDQAARDYRAVLAAHPNDYESWNNLGNVLAASSEFDAAVEALQRAIKLKPDFLPMVMNLSEVLSKADRQDERRAMLREAVRVSPEDAALQTELGLAESSVRDFEAAEHAYREAIRLDPRNASAFLELGLLLENLNRVDDLATLVEQAEANGLTGTELGFIKAWALRRQGRLEEALPLAQAAPASINPVRRAQLLAELYDRLGRPQAAFDAFVLMNSEAVATKPAPTGSTYREEVAADAALITPDQVATWTEVQVTPVPPAPIFIVGFPRSGTTLLDTLLMNIPHFHVLEELPILPQVEAVLRDKARVARLSSDEAEALRKRYFDIVEILSPGGTGRTIVDKHPLHMARMPIIHRIFPDAKVILVERHPCDAVLSCFMANFQLNGAMRSFTDLEEAARTYDVVFDAWTRATSLLPINFHRVRYERLVDDAENEMRALLAFLGLPWDPKVLDNQASAKQRGHIRTASYSQVTEPIYRRSAGRWQRYRDQLAPVLPILLPWAARLGYEA